MPYVTHIAESKEQEAAMKMPVGKVFRKDTYVDEEIYEEMIVAKARLLKDFPFWGILGLSLVMVEDTSGQIPTLATDGRHIFYNAKFMASLKRGERVFAVAHELYHCLFEHAGKKHRGLMYTGINPQATNHDEAMEIADKMRLWNFAVDFVVNDDLLQSGCGDFIKTISILHDLKYRGWASEQVFQHLLDHPEDRPDKGQTTLDVHIEIEIEEDGSGDGEGEAEAKYGKSGTGDNEGNGDKDGKSVKVKMKRSEYEKMRRDWQDNAVKAAAAQKEADARGGAGNIPAGIRRLLDDLTKPVYNWKQMLRRYVMSTMSRGYSFARPNRALFNAGFTIPGFRTHNQLLDIAIAVDTSGSIGQEELAMFVSEMDGILKSFPKYRIKAWCFDGEVIEDSITEITKINGKMDDITKFAKNIGGGGGTDFACNWEFMRENKMKPRLFLMFTDGYPYGSWGEPNYCPTMFLIKGNPNGNSPFGISLHFEDAL